MADNDLRIIQLKYSAKQIGAMTESEVSKWGKALLLKIHVITGWVIPEGNLMNILVDQFQKKMIESYPNTNTKEIEYAFRNYGTTVQDWGKAMNLALIDQVMIPYLEDRKRLSHDYEERKAEPPPQRIFTQQEIDDEHRADTEAFYQRLRRGVFGGMIPDYIRAILKKDGLIKGTEEADLFFTDRLNRAFENIYKKCDDKE